MSDATGDRGRGGQAGHSTSVNHLHSSNLTSGHFLGAVPRGWMLNNENTNVRGVHNQIPPQPQRQLPRANVQVPAVSTRTVEQTPPAHNLEAPSVPTEQPEPLAFAPTPHTAPDLRVDTSLDYWSGDGGSSVNTGAFENNAEVGLIGEINTGNAALRPTNGPNISSGVGAAAPASTTSIQLSTVIQNSPRHNISNQSGTHPVTIGPGSTTSSIVNALPGRHGVSVTTAGAGRSMSGDLTSARNLLVGSPASLSNTSPVAHTNVSAPTASIPYTHINATRSNSNPMLGQSMASHISMPAAVADQTQIPENAPQSHLSHLDQRMIAIVADKPPDHPGDLTYRLLYQFIRLRNISPQFLHTDLSFTPAHMQGLELFTLVLANNRNFTPEAILFSNKYANTFNALGIALQLQPSIPKAKYFLERFVSHWETLRTKIFKRGYLACAREVAEDLQSPHLILSQAMYTNLFFQMYPQASNEFSRDALNPFRESQYSYRLRIQHGLVQDRESTLSFEIREFLMLFQAMAQRHGQLPQNRLQPSLQTFRLPAAQPIQFSARPVSHNVSGVLDPRNLSLTSPVPQATAQIGNVPPLFKNNNGIVLFPDPGHLLPITAVPNPNRTALHQAHLCELPLHLMLPSGRTEQTPRLYSFLGCFVHEPKIIDDSTVFETWSLVVSPEIHDRFVQDYAAPKANPFGKKIRQVRNGSIMLHLRCIQIPNKTAPLNPAVCSATATTWPENVFISINGNHLEFRRKAHHGRDMPVDITRYILTEQNDFQLSYHATKRESGKSFALVFEAINILDHATVQQLPRPIDAQTSLANFTNSLKMASGDDDIMVSDPHISIDLIDPFTARICERPARGHHCRHRECFDLESFLQSRSCRNKDNFVHPDEWKCPLCGRDARPASLVIDNFLMQVKEKLVKDGKEDTKAILVKEDGSWEPKSEATDASTSRYTTPVDGKAITTSSSTADAKTSETATNTNTPVVTNTEVIVLDDD